MVLVPGIWNRGGSPLPSQAENTFRTEVKIRIPAREGGEFKGGRQDPNHPIRELALAPSRSAGISTSYLTHSLHNRPALTGGLYHACSRAGLPGAPSRPAGPAVLLPGPHTGSLASEPSPGQRPPAPGSAPASPARPPTRRCAVRRPPVLACADSGRGGPAADGARGAAGPYGSPRADAGPPHTPRSFHRRRPSRCASGEIAQIWVASALIR